MLYFRKPSQPYVVGTFCDPMPGSRMCSFFPVLRKAEVKGCARAIIGRSP